MTRSIVFAGGGSGGHVFPMIAVADELRELAPNTPLLFVGTARGLESKLVPSRGYQLELLDVLPLRGGGIGGGVRGAVRATTALGAARRLLRRVGASVVFSAGGYAAGPVALAARSLGVPVALMEPNSVVGLTNRLMAPLVKRAYTAFEVTDRAFSSRVRLRSGVPIRRGFAARPYQPAEPFRLLVLGGSQGAKALNENVPRAVAAVRSPLHVTHQCGGSNADAVRDLYRTLGQEERATVVPFIEDMPQALASADLVISRSGAGAVSEICAVGRPSLLVPYPFAAGNHQHGNAQALADRGAALNIPNAEATPERLAQEIARLICDPSATMSMAEAARALGRPDAAHRVARDLLEIAQIPIGGHGNGAEQFAPIQETG